MPRSARHRHEITSGPSMVSRISDKRAAKRGLWADLRSFEAEIQAGLSAQVISNSTPPQAGPVVSARSEVSFSLGSSEFQALDDGCLERVPGGLFEEPTHVNPQSSALPACPAAAARRAG